MEHRSVWNIFQRKQSLCARIAGVQKRLVERRMTHVKTEPKVRVRIGEDLKQEELLWFQRFREEWIISGDRKPDLIMRQL